MKRKIIFIISVPIVIILLFVSVLAGPMIRNQILLEKYAAQLYKIPLPPNTLEISRDKGVGNLYGTGNHLDFAAVIEIESTLSEDELIAFYQDKAKDLKSADEISLIGLNSFYLETNIDHSVQEIEVIPKAQAMSLCSDSKVFIKRNTADPDIKDDLYLIQLKDTHYAPGLDPRAN